MVDLAAVLRSPEATNEDVLVYLQARVQQITEAGGVAMPIADFWRSFADLDAYRQAQAIWATDAPPRFALPDLPTLLNGVAGPAGMPQSSFIQDLTRLWEQYAAWMQSEERDPYRPEESAQKRRLRIARESMARTRARRAGSNPLLDEAKQRHDAYLAACRKRKDALAELDNEVRSAWAAYEDARDAAKG